MIRPLFALIGHTTVTLIAILVLSLIDALTPVEVPEPRQFIDIVNPLHRGAINERIPASLTENWPTWTWSLQSKQWEQIQGQDEELGFVNPFSIDYLWQPVDLNPPQCTLSLAIHCRNGVPRHLLPAIDVSYIDRDHRHPNRGLHTSPRAWQWFDFTSYVAGSRKCRLELRTFDALSEGGEEDDSYHELQTLHGIDKMVDKVLQALSDEPPTEVGDGSVIVQVVAATTLSFDLPKQNQILSAALIEDDNSIIGSLDVMVQTTLAGSQSEYLPDVYKTLFEDDLRPEYKEFQERKASRDQ